MNKTKVLNYAIDRINKYDKPSAKKGLGNCNICDLVGHVCRECPFYDIDKVLHCSNHKRCGDKGGVKARQHGINIKSHQDILIKRTKDWCKRFYPKFTIEKI